MNMSLRSVIPMVLGGFIILFFSGCIVKRTVTEDGVTVARGYVYKGLLEP